MLLMIVLEGKHKSIKNYIKIMVIFFGSILIIINLKEKKIKTIDNFTIEIIMDKHYFIRESK